MPDDEKRNDGEQWAGFDDAVSVWMALVTERERLQRIVDTGIVQEPMFGAPATTKRLSPAEVLDARARLGRVAALAALAFERRARIGAAFSSGTGSSILDEAAAFARELKIDAERIGRRLDRKRQALAEAREKSQTEGRRAYQLIIMAEIVGLEALREALDGK